ncbi:hypothetical protein ACHAWO_004066 [Cyclotella atomus]|uniref:Uncharacterized protein n=1 Tax=Cyclotella atomus TaxID=382360 RepID=A0ABD3N1L8_9STRA
MKTSIAFIATLVSRSSAFAPAAPKIFTRNMSSNAVPLANGAMSFDRVCREWRCKYTGDKATSESLEKIAALVEEYLPQIKAVSSDAKVNRLVCGACLDFKLMTTVPLDDFGPWEAKGYAPEAEFLEKLKAIDGVSQVETQTITNMEI